MTLPGRVQNGVIVFDNPAHLPEGTAVTVLVMPNHGSETPKPLEPMPEAEHRRVQAILDEIAALPNENPGDRFSGRDHDQILYGERR